MTLPNTTSPQGAAMNGHKPSACGGRNAQALWALLTTIQFAVLATFCTQAGYATQTTMVLLTRFLLLLTLGSVALAWISWGQLERLAEKSLEDAKSKAMDANARNMVLQDDNQRLRTELQGLEMAAMDSVRQDESTGALLLKSFLEFVNHEIESSRRTEVPLCMMTLQADNPDADGGQQTLRRLAELLRERIRNSDRLAIISDNQLAVMMHNTTIEDASPVCEGFVDWVRGEFDIAISVGLSELLVNRDRAQSLLDRSLQALQHARSDVGNRLSTIQFNISSHLLGALK